MSVYLGEAPPITSIVSRIVGTVYVYYTLIPSLDDKGHLTLLTSIVSVETVMSGEETSGEWQPALVVKPPRKVVEVGGNG